MDIVDEEKKQNPLGTENVSSLMVRFAIPSIIAMMVGSIYNLVDQIFIGHAVGTNGNAATNIAFPLAMCCTAIALLFGIGGASCFNLAMGRGKTKEAGYYVGNAVSVTIILGIILSVGTLVFLTPLLKLFGSSNTVLPYAKEYVGITAIGFPFLILTIAGGHLIRGDGSPNMTMICSISGAVINTVLDYVFVIRMDMGMAGAAYATIIGQIFSGCLVIWYMTRFKTVQLRPEHFIPKMEYIGRVASIGMASCFNQLAMLVVQVILNNSLKIYGAKSIYGEDIPIAVSGIVIKVFQLLFAIVIGISQGIQPIVSFNYGAKKYDRVKEAYIKALYAGGFVCAVGFVLFQIFPRQILRGFGKGSAEYFEFGVMYFRIYLACVIINFLQPISATFFTSIGKAIKGVFLSLTRQIIYLLPLLLILPRFFGIDGILYTGPIADLLAAVTTIIMVVYEFKNMNNE